MLSLYSHFLSNHCIVQFCVSEQFNKCEKNFPHPGKVDTSSPLTHLLNHFQIPVYQQWVIYIENPMVIGWDFAIKQARRTIWFISIRYKYFLYKRNFFSQPRVIQSVSKAYKFGKIIILMQFIPVVYSVQSKIKRLSVYTPLFIYGTKQLHVAATDYSQHQVICKNKIKIFL
jgi:hypothetical protein